MRVLVRFDRWLAYRSSNELRALILLVFVLVWALLRLVSAFS